ncbi:MAG: UbiA family prenyltransferase [Syntrophobacterales bacterium]|nr:UbiA family prenyltransferase [Syntrophobacterales bacterium]
MALLKLTNYLRLLRLSHWLKNCLIFVPIFFGKKIFHEPTLVSGIKGFLYFSLVASGIYILNDYHDRKRDRYHPEKALRPIAAGIVSVPIALSMAVGLLFSGLTLGFMANIHFGIILVVYILLSETYSLKLKHIAPLDVMCIATGYLLRILGGSTISGIEVSRWLFLAGFFVALFISLTKRLGELQLEQNYSHRITLSVYSADYILTASAISASAALVTFGLYSLERGGKFIYAVIPASYGLLRYLLVVTNRKGSEPIQIFLKDTQLQIVSFIFLVIIGWVIYH